MLKLVVGNYCEFDICKERNNYKSGKIIDVNKDEVTIAQDFELYDGNYFNYKTTRVRNWKYDVERGAMVI